MPAVIYRLESNARCERGWVFRRATDLAFAVGVWRCLESGCRRVAVLLLALAIIDDIVAILYCFFTQTGISFLGCSSRGRHSVIVLFRASAYAARWNLVPGWRRVKSASCDPRAPDHARRDHR